MLGTLPSLRGMYWCRRTQSKRRWGGCRCTVGRGLGSRAAAARWPGSMFRKGVLRNAPSHTTVDSTHSQHLFRIPYRSRLPVQCYHLHIGVLQQNRATSVTTLEPTKDVRIEFIIVCTHIRKQFWSSFEFQYLQFTSLSARLKAHIIRHHPNQRTRTP